MPPNATRARLTRLTLLILVAAVVTAVVLRSFGAKPAAVQAAERRVAALERESGDAAARAAVVVARAADARAATKPALARVDALRARVQIAGTGQLRVEDAGAAVATLVPVPPLVTDRIRADSLAISALSVALTRDTIAAAAQEERLVAEAKTLDAARFTIAALERERKPRCGRRCGMVLGALSIVALGIAVDQTRHIVHP